MMLRASISRSLAPRLVIGGLPRSRLPLLLAALALASGLLAAAILLFRRERALADLRSDFVSSVSHELRTPLAQIRLFAETLLLDRIRSPEERRRSLEIIDCEARRLAQLVENTLQLLARRAGGDRRSTSRTGTSPGWRGRRSRASRRSPTRGKARVSTDIPETLTARVDEGAVRQILLNLLDNAVKYGPEGQEILVTLKEESGAVRLSVEDRARASRRRTGSASGGGSCAWNATARLTKPAPASAWRSSPSSSRSTGAARGSRTAGAAAAGSSSFSLKHRSAA